MGKKYKFDLFLCHSTRDKPTVRALADRLENDGLRIWFDERTILPGDHILSAIDKGLQSSRKVVLCISRSFLKSAWAALESSFFRGPDPLNKRRRCIPLLLDGTKPKGTLTQFSYINYAADQDTAYPQLLAACRPPISKGRSCLDSLRQPVAQRPALCYFAYISATKVHELLPQVGPPFPRKLPANIANGVGPNWKTQALRGIMTNTSFGRYERSLLPPAERARLVNELISALVGIDRDFGPLPNLRGLLHSRGPKVGRIFTYAGPFRVMSSARRRHQAPALDVPYVSLRSEDPSGSRLLLTCSVRFFSDMGEVRGTCIPHSGNAMFFAGKVDLPFLTVAYLMDHNRRTAYGTPLFLALPLSGNVLI